MYELTGSIGWSIFESVAQIGLAIVVWSYLIGDMRRTRRRNRAFEQGRCCECNRPFGGPDA